MLSLLLVCSRNATVPHGSYFRYGISKIKIDGAEVIPLRLADALDGKDTDYKERLNLYIGGKKLASLILDRLGV